MDRDEGRHQRRRGATSRQGPRLHALDLGSRSWPPVPLEEDADLHRTHRGLSGWPCASSAAGPGSPRAPSPESCACTPSTLTGVLHRLEGQGGWCGGPATPATAASRSWNSPRVAGSSTMPAPRRPSRPSSRRSSPESPNPGLSRPADVLAAVATALLEKSAPTRRPALPRTIPRPPPSIGIIDRPAACGPDDRHMAMNAHLPLTDAACERLQCASGRSPSPCASRS